jgi:hypothetical protein
MSQPISIQVTRTEVIEATSGSDDPEFQRAVIRLILWNRGLDIDRPFTFFITMTNDRVFSGEIRSDSHDDMVPMNYGGLERHQPPELV